MAYLLLLKTTSCDFSSEKFSFQHSLQEEILSKNSLITLYWE